MKLRFLLLVSTLSLLAAPPLTNAQEILSGRTLSRVESHANTNRVLLGFTTDHSNADGCTHSLATSRVAIDLTDQNANYLYTNAMSAMMAGKKVQVVTRNS